MPRLYPLIAVLCAVLSVLLIGFFFRMITRDYYRLPRRVRLEHDISVPSLPAPGVQPVPSAGDA